MTLLATGGLAVAAAAPASAYTNVYKSERACLTAQRSLGHNSSIVITDPCHAVHTGCITGSNGLRICNTQYDFSWRYR